MLKRLTTLRLWRVDYVAGKKGININFKTIFGESNYIPPELVIDWKKTSLPTLLSNYDLRDTYNADEFGLFHKRMTNKTYKLISENCSGES